MFSVECRRRPIPWARDPQSGDEDGGQEPSGWAKRLGASLDVLTPGFSLIDQVEGPFRDALARALGGRCEKDPRGDRVVEDEG